MTIDVSAAQRGEVSSLAATLGRAFYEDLVMMWMMPDGPRRQRFGFEVTGEIAVHDGGPVMPEMWRNPR